MNVSHAVQQRGQNSAGESRGKRLAAWVSWAAWAGIIGPVLFTAAFLAQEAFRRGEYDPVAERVSALEAGPNGWIQQINFVVFGLLTIAFAVGLHRGLRSSRAGIVGPGLLFVSGIGLLAAAAYPLREDAAGVTYDPGGHIFAGPTFFLSSALGLIVVSRRLARDPRWHSIARYTLLAGIVAFGGFRGSRRAGCAGRRSAARLGRLVPAVDHPCCDISLPHCSVAQAAAGCERAAVMP